MRNGLTVLLFCLSILSFGQTQIRYSLEVGRELPADTSSFSDWNPVTNTHTNFTAFDSVVWFYIDLRGLDMTNYLLLGHTSNTRNGEVYQKTEEGWKQILKIRKGRVEEAAFDVLPFRSFYLPHAGGNEYLFRSSMIFDRNYRFETGPSESVFDKLWLHDTFARGFIILMISIFLYNLFLGITTQERMFIPYLLYIGYVSIMLPNHSGFLVLEYDWFLENNIVWTAMGYFAPTWFAHEYLNLNERPKFLRWLVWSFVAILSFLYPLLHLTGLSHQLYLTPTTYILSLGYNFSLLFVGIFLWIKGVKTARFYTLAWTSIVVSMFVMLFSLGGAIPWLNDPFKIIYVGFSMEAILFAIAIGDKMTSLRRENERMKQEKLELVQQRNEELDRSIRNKTHELEEAYQNLLVLNEQLNSTNLALEQKNEVLESTMEELQKAEEYLIETEKMSAIGTLTAGVSHELNNPLNFISQGLYQIESELQSRENRIYNDLQPFIQAAVEGVKRILDISATLNMYVGRANDENGICEIHEILDSCLKLSGTELQEIEIRHDYQAQKSRIKGQLSDLTQAFFKIIQNASQALKGQPDGRIILTTTNIGQHLRVSIADNGPGIPKKHLKNIFDPFFTTREPGEGVGLGLSISQRIFQAHKGVISCESKVQEGTTFTIDFAEAL